MTKEEAQQILIEKYSKAEITSQEFIDGIEQTLQAFHPTTLPSDWTKQCSCSQEDKTGEAWCCNKCGKPTPRLSTELPSDEEIKASAINNLMHIKSPASDGLEFSTAEENIAIEAYVDGAKDLRSIASARIAEVERKLQEAKQLVRNITEFADGMKVLDGEALRVLKNTARRVLSDKPTQFPRK